MSEKDVLGAFLLVNNPIVLSEEETKDVQKVIKQLQQENKQLQTTANNCKRLKEEYNKIQKAYESTFSDYQQLKDNWNKLKGIIKKKFIAQGGFTSYEWNDLLCELLNKMQELEQGSGSDVKD